MSRAALFALAALAGACASPAEPPPDGPYVLVLGTAQDGGLPQIGCDGPHCRAARADERRARLVASLLLVDPASGQRFLIDATPDLVRQVERARDHPPGRRPPGPRPALFDGILLTHAHVGHYTGLVHLGREAYGAHGVPLLTSASMRAFLETNGPWSLLFEQGAVVPETLVPGQTRELAPGLTVTPFCVPHRDELSDTLGFRIDGPRGSLLYVPDIDAWDPAVLEELAGVDVALLDGTFFDAGELPGRDLSEIPHPLMVDSLERLHGAAAGGTRILFTHLNHSNPAVDPGSTAARTIRAAGFEVARDGQLLPL